MVLDVALLNTQHYKGQIKGTVEQSREWSNALLYTLVEKVAFGLHSTMVTNFTYNLSVLKINNREDIYDQSIKIK